MKFCIELGDPSADGHGISEKIFIESNIKLDVLEKAYEDSCKKTGIDFKKICQNYEDNILPEDIRVKFVELGCPLKDILELDDEEPDEDGGELYLDEEPFIKLLMWFIGLSVTGEFKWEIIQDKVRCFSKSFGYGLYSN